MAIQITKVKPGELITSDFINGIIDALLALDTRIAKLEAAGAGGGAPIITALNPDPTQEEVRMGDELRIIGKNLSTSTLVSVTIGGEDVKQYKQGSSDSLLIVDIPTILGIPDEGDDVDLVVTNTQGYDVETFTLLPGETTTLSATLTVTNTVVPTEVITADGSTYDYTFTISALTTLDEDYTLVPSIDPTSWSVEAVDSQGTEITEISIPKSQPTASTHTVIVRVTVPVGATGSAKLKLTLVAKNFPTVTGFSGNVDISVGSTPDEVTDAFEFTDPNAIPSGSFDTNGNLLVASGSKVTYLLPVRPKDAGKYLIAEPVIENDPNKYWEAKVLNSPTDFTTSTPDEPKTIKIELKATSSSAPETSMVVRVSKFSDSTVFAERDQTIKLK
ncbi:MAG: hypothetical protein HW389_892 [Bacteroidetes bacterium]|nr:hypothetical protein [Bacteroidota bacterium]